MSDGKLAPYFLDYAPFGVITQAANTGLTGGSKPDGNDYDRDVVLRRYVDKPCSGGSRHGSLEAQRRSSGDAP